MSLLSDARRLMQKLMEDTVDFLSIFLSKSHGDITVPIWVVIGLSLNGDAASRAESSEQLSSEGNPLLKQKCVKLSIS